MQIRGDAFVARIFDNDDTFLRKDFTLPEMDPSTAPWFAIAKAENLQNVQEIFAMQHCRPTHARSRASNLCMCTHAHTHTSYCTVAQQYVLCCRRRLTDSPRCKMQRE